MASKLVPFMVGLYLLQLYNYPKKYWGNPSVFKIIFQDAFTGKSVAGGAIGTMIIIGVRRGLFQ